MAPGKPHQVHELLPDWEGVQSEPWIPPTQEEIRRRAYELYLERERQCGGALDDWLEAEAELFLNHGKSD